VGNQLLLQHHPPKISSNARPAVDLRRVTVKNVLIAGSYSTSFDPNLQQPALRRIPIPANKGGYVKGTLVPGEQVVHLGKVHWAVYLQGIILLPLCGLGMLFLIRALITD
jgi:hypothetical protein